jgi:uncharacterized repeat protein (TIGR03803 family)
MKTTHLAGYQTQRPRKLSTVSISFLLCVTLISAVLITSAQAQTYSVLYSFAGGTGDGATPSGLLVEDGSGNFYGTTASGGASNAGTVFELTSSGVESVLYSFTGASDGAVPQAGVFRDTDGTLYGTTNSGGDSVCKCGTVFKLSPALELTVLHQFKGVPADGANPGPSSRLISVNGELYSVTTYGGNSNQCGNEGCGVVFRVTKGGKETLVYQFQGAGDGIWPVSLVRDAAGILYGSAQGGWGGAGTTYKLDTSGNFLGYVDLEYQDGSYVIGHIIVDTNGNIHGLTSWAGHNGCSRGCGSIYDIDSATGTVTAISKFSAGAGGSKSAAGVVDVGGVLYGTTQQGGTSTNCTDGCGVIYQLSKTSQYSALHSFTGTDGALGGEMVLGRDGSLYGVTSAGGSGSCTGTTNGCGIIFKYTP